MMTTKVRDQFRRGCPNETQDYLKSKLATVQIEIGMGIEMGIRIRNK